MRLVHTSSARKAGGAGRPQKNRVRSPFDYGLVTPNERAMIISAIEAGEREACGALLLAPGGDAERLREVENVAPEQRSFRMADRDVVALARLDWRWPGIVRAIWHSHPSGSLVPSAGDLRAHPRWARYLVIVCPDERTVHYFAREDDVWEPLPSLLG